MSDHNIYIAEKNEAEDKRTALERIAQASNEGNVRLLYDSFSLHPKILDKIDKKRFVHTPLHEAARMGHAKFCAEMMNLMPSFGKKLNPNGLSPLHLALHHSEDHTALTLVGIDKKLVRVKGIDGITPLMYCARHEDKNDTLAMLLRDCPQAIFDVSTKSETALHVALKNGNCDGAVMILNWLRRSSREKILHWKDDEGNTPLHLAVNYKCTKAVEILVGKTRLNTRNLNHQTPLDIANGANNEEAIKLLKSKKAKTSNQLAKKFSYADFLRSPMTCFEGTIKTYTIMMTDLDADMRNVVLVVAVLIATATYTAMLQPPGGIYQASATTNTTTTNTNHASSSMEQKSNAGKMVMNHYNYKRFMPTNTLAFTLAIVVIIFVLPGRPYTFALHLSLLSLSYSCLIAMHYVSEENSTAADVSFFLGWVLLALAAVLKLAYYLLMKGFLWDVWWVPHYNVRARNLVESCFDGHAQNVMSLMSKFRKQYRLTVGSLSEN